MSVDVTVVPADFEVRPCGSCLHCGEGTVYLRRAGFAPEVREASTPAAAVSVWVVDERDAARKVLLCRACFQICFAWRQELVQGWISQVGLQVDAYTRARISVPVRGQPCLAKAVEDDSTDVFSAALSAAEA